jgi:hypothetical protein
MTTETEIVREHRVSPLLYLLGAGVAGFIVYRLYRSFHLSVADIESEVVVDASKKYMANGFTYLSYAEMLVSAFFVVGWFGLDWTKNTDESYVIKLLNDVRLDEFSKLSDAYSAYKAKKSGFLPSSSSLLEDVRGALSVSEIQQLTTLGSLF